MLRLLIDTSEFQSGQRTGIGQFLYNFLDYWSAVVPDNAELALWPACPEPLAQQLGSPPVYGKLSEAIKSFRPTVFFSPSYKLPSSVVRAGIPSISTVHDTGFATFRPYWRGHTYQFIARQRLKYFFEKATAIFAVSEQTRDEIKALNRAVPDEKISVIYNTLPSPDWDEADKEDIYLTVTNFKPHKNTVFAGQALAAMRTETKPKWVVIGPGGEFRRQFLKDIQPLSGQLEIDLHEDVDRETLWSWYRRARWFLYPSLYEGFGLPPAEALTAGCQVVINRLPVFEEMFVPDLVHFCRTNDMADWLEALDSKPRALAADAIMEEFMPRFLLTRWGHAMMEVLRDVGGG